MIGVVIDQGLGAFGNRLSGIADDFANVSFDADVLDFLSTANLQTLTPLSLSSSVIRLGDAMGRTLRFDGSGFGPIKLNTSLENAAAAFLDAIEAIDGSATGTLTRVTIKDGAATLLDVNVSKTQWTIQSGDVTLSLRGSLPTAIDDVNAGIVEMFDLSTGKIKRSFDPDSSIFGGYKLSDLAIAIDGKTEAAAHFGSSGVTLTSGHYALTLKGHAPSNVADAISYVYDLQNGLTAPDYRISSAELSDTATGKTIMTVDGVADLTNFDLFGSASDTLEIRALDAYGELPESVSMGAGADTVRLRISVPLLSSSDMDGDAYDSAAIIRVNGESGTDTVDYSATSFGIAVALFGTQSGSIGYLHRNASGADVSWWALAYVENIVGTDFNDKFEANLANNVISGGGGADRIFGSGGNDLLDGGFGDDLLDGGNGADRLFGDAGRDRLTGGDGIDTLDGGAARDTLIGGNNRDFYQYKTEDFGNDRIIGWQDGIDRIKISSAGLTFTDFRVSEDGGDTILTLRSDPLNTITLAGIDKALIDITDFV